MSIENCYHKRTRVKQDMSNEQGDLKVYTPRDASMASLILISIVQWKRELVFGISFERYS